MEQKYNLKPFDKVLVRDDRESEWIPQLFSYYYSIGNYSYGVMSGIQYRYCIPYEGNEHLAGTTDDYVEPYVPKDGDFVARYVNGNLANIFICQQYDKTGCFVYANMWCDTQDKEPYSAKFNSLGYIRPATKEEKQQLLSNLAEVGKKWNAEMKCIEDIWTPKDGDFVAVTRGTDVWLCICDHFERRNKLIYKFGLTSNRHVIVSEDHYDTDGCVFRPATKEEKQFILSKLAEIGKKWNAEEKRIEDMWVPKDGDFVYVEYNGWNDRTKKTLFIFREGDNKTESYLMYDVMENRIERQKYVCDDKKIQRYRQATEKEKQLFLSKIAEIREKWDPEKKCVESCVPKDGDFVVRYVNGHFTNIFICSQYDKKGCIAHVVLWCDTGDVSYTLKRQFNSPGVISIATNEEKTQLINQLHKLGMDWDAAKKKVVELKRKPNTDEKYYFVNSVLIVQNEFWTNRQLDKQRYITGNCFGTYNEAQAMADKFKELLKGENHA